MGNQNKKPDYDLAFTHLQNNQNITAYNLFLDLAEKQKKIDDLRAGLLFMLASEARSRQKKDGNSETLEAGKLFLSYAKNEKNFNRKNAFLCAAKCFLKAGNYDQAKKAFEQSKKIKTVITELSRPIVIVDDSKAVVIKLENYLKKLGYAEIISYQNGNDIIKEFPKLIKSTSPIFLLDMGLPDVDGDVVAAKIFEEKPDSQIILITADEKSTKRVSKTISSGVTAFIQKPFTLNDLKDALNTAETEFSLL